MLCLSVFVRPPILWLRVGFCTLCSAKVRLFCEMNKLFKSFFSFYKRKRSQHCANSLIFLALQDGLEPEYMKLTEIIRNYKKLNTNKLHKRIER